MVESGVKSVVLGSIVDKAEKDRLIVCLHAQCIGSRFGKPFFLCALGSGACRSGGQRFKFSFHFDGFHVTWICDRLDGFPDLEM